jgi:hypothetical protein
MQKVSFKLATIMIIVALLVFSLEIIFPTGVFSAFYILVVLISLWGEDELLIGGVIGSFILILIGYFYTLNNFEITSLINKSLSFVMVGITAFLGMQRKEVEVKLKRLNETLELRVLARIASSEHKAKRLEKQIEILQEFRKEKTDTAFQALDDIISNLKTLAVENTRDSFFEMPGKK